MLHLLRNVTCRAFLALAILLSFARVHVWAQATGSGTVTGTVRDPNAGAVPDATVTIRSNTGIDRQVQSNGSGVYTAPFLPPGVYEVSATKQGFAKLVRKELTLQVGQ